MKRANFSEMNLPRAGNSKVGGGKDLAFRTDVQTFGVPIAEVVQLVGKRSITETPDNPPYVKGGIPPRGAAIPAIYIRQSLEKPETEYTGSACAIVSDTQYQNFRFLLDRVEGASAFPANLISPPPRIDAGRVARYLTGCGRTGGAIEKGMALLPDRNRIILGQNKHHSPARTARYNGRDC